MPIAQSATPRRISLIGTLMLGDQLLEIVLIHVIEAGELLSELFADNILAASTTSILLLILREFSDIYDLTPDH